MFVKCPSCQTLLKIPEEKISAHGTHLRCPKCSTIFMVKPPNMQAPTRDHTDPEATRIMPNVPKQDSEDEAAPMAPKEPQSQRQITKKQVEYNVTFTKKS